MPPDARPEARQLLPLVAQPPLHGRYCHEKLMSRVRVAKAPARAGTTSLQETKKFFTEGAKMCCESGRRGASQAGSARTPPGLGASRGNLAARVENFPAAVPSGGLTVAEVVAGGAPIGRELDARQQTGAAEARGGSSGAHGLVPRVVHASRAHHAAVGCERVQPEPHPRRRHLGALCVVEPARRKLARHVGVDRSVLALGEEFGIGALLG